jgi:hypothetical protein
MLKTEMQEYALTSTTVDEINGITVGVGGVYKDPDTGAQKVNLTINRIPNVGLAIGDSVKFGDQTWTIIRFEKGRGKRHGEVILGHSK